jgi:hypothetical protein
MLNTDLTQPETPAPNCIWLEDGDGEGNYETGCGNMFSIIADTPLANGMVFCCYCGKPLEVCT